MLFREGTLKKVNSICIKYSKTQTHQSNDLFQHVCLKLIERGATQESVGYVCVAAHNICKSYIRDNKKHSAVPLLDTDLGTTSQSHVDVPLSAAISNLPSKQMIVIQYFLKDYTLKEISQELGVPYNTVKANYRHAVENLRKFIT